MKLLASIICFTLHSFIYGIDISNLASSHVDLLSKISTSSSLAAVPVIDSLRVGECSIGMSGMYFSNELPPSIAVKIGWRPHEKCFICVGSGITLSLIPHAFYQDDEMALHRIQLPSINTINSMSISAGIGFKYRVKKHGATK